MLTASLNVVAGWTGLLSLGHVGFYGIGAYVYAFLASPHFGVHLPFLAAVAAAGLVTGAVGSLVGAVSLRLRGDYLAMVTLAFAEIVRNLAISLDRPVNLTGGVNGILNLDMPSIGGFEFREMGAYYYLIWGLALAGSWRRSRACAARGSAGPGWRSARTRWRPATWASRCSGTSCSRSPSSAVLAGMAGSVFAAWQGSVFPESFTIQQTAILYAMLVVSGAAGMPGIVVGAAALTILPEWLRDYGVYRMLLLRGAPRPGDAVPAPGLLRRGAPPIGGAGGDGAGRGAGPRAGGLMALLEVRGLTKRFGGSTAVAAVDLDGRGRGDRVRDRAERGGEDDALRARLRQPAPGRGERPLPGRRSRGPAAARDRPARRWSGPSRRAACSRT